MDYPSTSNAHQIQFEVRDDEEQRQKLEDCIQLLVASGYFRARISGLKPFDKIVGGLVWCISLCNLSLDVDLLYSDNATIKQKIQVTEKIVRVLPQLECPYSLEPHQIQGLDCIHIYPVVQWFVKKAMEGRVARADQQETLISTITDRHLGKVSKPKASPAAVVSRFIFEEEKKPRSSPSKEVKTAKDELQQLEERIRAAQEESALLDKELNEEAAQAEIIQRDLKELELEKQRRDQLKENLSEGELEEIRRLVEEMELVRADEKMTKHGMRDKIQQMEDRIERINLVGQIAADEDLIREWEHSEAALRQERQSTGEVTRKLMECQRQLDSTPSGNEMAQYQQRFIELYNQMATLNRTTKQYHTLYNTLIDVQEFIEKESTVLNNIEQVLPDATKNEYRDSFVKNLQEIQRKVESTHSKLESTNQQFGNDRSSLAAKLLNLKQLHRQFNILSEKFKQECEAYEASNK